MTTQPDPWVAKWAGYKTKNPAQPYPLRSLEVTTQPDPWVAKWAGYKTENLAQPYPLCSLNFIKRENTTIESIVSTIKSILI